jgi:GNAT superfamily N-acetyltransferase
MVGSEHVAIRRAFASDARSIAEVHVTAWRETYCGIVPDSYLDGLSVDEREALWRRLDTPSHPGFAFVAVNGAGRVLGFASGGPRRDGPDEYAGELNAIYLLRDVQGRGIGRRLVAAVARELAARGMRSMLLWVFTENPARGFYEALGGKLLTAQQFEIEGVTITEVSYGWPDAAVLYADDDDGGEQHNGPPR